MPDRTAGIYKCIIIDDEPLARDVIRRYIEQLPTLVLVKEYGNAIDAMLYLQQQNVDLLFLDIQMPHLSGTEFLRALRNAPRVIFTTAHKEYALEGFDLDVIDYLLKPIQFDRFLKAVGKALPQKNEELPEKNMAVKADMKINSGFIYLKSERKMVKVMLDDILYIESARDYLKVFTRDNAILTRQTTSSIEAMLSENEFIRIHRSFIVSINKINSFTHEVVEIGKRELPVGKVYINNLLRLRST